MPRDQLWYRYNMTPEQIASVCHAANTQLQYILEDPMSPPWDELDMETQNSAINGVLLAQVGSTPRDMHASWRAFKEANGWTFGEVKDTDAKTHPNMIDYDDLPAEQQMKDHLFSAIVLALSPEE